MKTKYSNKVSNVFSSLYRRVMGEEMSLDAKKFLKDFSLVIAGSGISTILTFAFGILGGRFLGPEEYGKYTLLQSAFDFLTIPMVLGFSIAMVKYLSATKEIDQQSRIVATSYFLTIISTIICIVVFLILRTQLAGILSVTLNLYYFALVIGATQVLYTITTSTQRGLGKMSIFAFLQPIYGGILLVAFIIFSTNKNVSFEAMAYPQLFAFLVVGVIALINVRKWLYKPKFDRPWAAILSKYAFFAIITGFSSAIYTNVGKIFINRYMTISDVGIYNAYYSPSLNVASIVLITFNLVFFPAASKYEDKKVIFRKIDRLVPLLFAVGMPLVFILEFVILKLYGGDYPVDWILMLIFACSAILIVCYGIYSTTFSSEGLRGIMLNNISFVTIALLDVLLSIVLIPRFGLKGSIGAILVSFTCGVICLWLLRNILTKKGDTVKNSFS
jgi:O-antigen/teichoic acid export membrane protein